MIKAALLIEWRLIQDVSISEQGLDNVGFTTRWQITLFVHDERIISDSNKRH